MSREERNGWEIKRRSGYNTGARHRGKISGYIETAKALGPKLQSLNLNCVCMSVLVEVERNLGSLVEE